MTMFYAALGASFGLLAAILLGAGTAHPVWILLAVPLIASVSVFLAALVRARPASRSRPGTLPARRPARPALG
jgi:amino acid transporter